jgi:hypothetical protein
LSPHPRFCVSQHFNLKPIVSPRHFSVSSPSALFLPNQIQLFDPPLPSLSSFVQSLSSPAPSILPPLSLVAARSAGAPPSLLATNLLLSASAGAPFLNVDAFGQPLKDAGKLSNLRLVSLLSASGILETTTHCLFRHVSRPISFVLVVDDFGIKYQNRDDNDYLISCLSRLYHVKSHPIASKFLGFAITHDRSQRTLSLSYPGYIDALLHRLRPHGVKPAASPAVYHPPVYGSLAPQHATTDSSPPASTAQKKELEIAIGYLLYYGRCVDGRVLTATCALASAQTTATLATMADLDRLLGFVFAHPNGMKIFRPQS